MQLNNSGNYWSYSSNDCVCVQHMVEDQNALLASPNADTATLCASNKGYYC